MIPSIKAAGSGLSDRTDFRCLLKRRKILNDAFSAHFTEGISEDTGGNGLPLLNRDRAGPVTVDPEGYHWIEKSGE
jgi:hypothetical protein